jgi:hypothetical protein
MFDIGFRSYGRLESVHSSSSEESVVARQPSGRKDVRIGEFRAPVTY